MKIFLILNVLLISLFAQIGTIPGGSGGGAATISTYVVATLPTSPMLNQIVQITDGSTATDCTVGSGSIVHLCTWNGSTWIGSPSSVSGSSGVTNLATNNGLTGGPVTSTGTVGLATISNNKVLCNNSGGTAAPTTANCAVTGTGNAVLATSPTLVAPALGTPTAVVLSSGTGLPLTTGVTGTLPVANGGTGVTTAQGNGSKVQLSTGSTTTNDCVKFDVNGNTVDAGTACGTGATIDPCAATQTSSTITFFAAATSTAYCGVPTGPTTVRYFTSAIALTLPSGSDTWYAGVLPGGGLAVGANTATGTCASCSGGVTQTGITSVATLDPYAVPIATFTSVSTSFTAITLLKGTMPGAFPLTAGSNITLTNSGSSVQIAANNTGSSAPGTSHTFSGTADIFICSSTCTLTVPVPVQGVQYCALNGDNVTTVITMSAIGSSARYENQARTAFGTAGTGTLVSGGAAADMACIYGQDSTHYLTVSTHGTWTAN
jgi:hypothetical protein